MRLIVQPEDGVVPVVAGIRSAKKTLDMPIFRLDHIEVDKAIKSAVKRGVIVRTLIAHTNTGGEKGLRKLEQRLLATGATVSRTADDLVRYHNKFMIIDGKTLFVMGFNYTHLDIDRSRSFGIIATNRRLVQEAVKLFDADFNRQPYEAGMKQFLVSPENSRAELAAFLRGARKQLLIYDVRITDNAMIRILRERAKAGVEIKMMGKLQKKDLDVLVEKFPGKLHARAIIQDGKKAFIGSQSLRRLELDERREVGVIFNDEPIVRQLVSVFESDWAETDTGKKELEEMNETAMHKAMEKAKKAKRKAKQQKKKRK
ncbi:MAG TPA: phospholipase D-like domain-containing protein [Gemmatimonadaceae bacterium]